MGNLLKTIVAEVDEDVTVEGRSVVGISVSEDDIWSCTFYNSMLVGPYCGDGEVNQGWEECDGDNQRICTTSEDYVGNQDCEDCMWGECVPVESCGDEIKNGNEECDDGFDGSEECNPDCTLIEEECDYFVGGYKYEANTRPVIRLNGWEIQLKDESGEVIATTTTAYDYMYGDGFYHP